MRVAVIIPTTDGPAPILKLTRLVQAPRSLMRTQDDYRPLPPSARYHAFIQPGGPLAERIGPGGGQFELRLGAPVETGRSWELPVALGHWLLARGNSLDAEEPELVIWATGALDNDLSVLPQDYHLATKLDRSAAMLNGWLDRGVPVLLLLPEEVDVSAALRHPRVSLHRVKALAEAITVIETRQPLVGESGPVISAPKPARRRQLVLAGAAGLMLSALFWLFAGSPPAGTANETAVLELASLPAPATPEVADIRQPDAGESAFDPAGDHRPEREPRFPAATARPEVVAASAPEAVSAVLPRLILEHAPDGGSCRSVLFGEDAPRRAELIAVEGAFQAVAAGDLCGLAFHLPGNAMDAAEIMLPPELAELILPSDRQARFMIAPGENRRVRLRAVLPARIEAEVTVTFRTGRDPVRLRVVIERAG